MPKKKPAKNHMLKKSVNMIYQVYQHTESHEHKKKKKNEGES